MIARPDWLLEIEYRMPDLAFVSWHSDESYDENEFPIYQPG